jgi:hypothetical protein
VKISAIDSAFERALSAEIAASELLRMRVLAVTLAVLLVSDELVFLFARNLVEQSRAVPEPDRKRHIRHVIGPERVPRGRGRHLARTEGFRYKNRTPVNRGSQQCVSYGRSLPT